MSTVATTAAPVTAKRRFGFGRTAAWAFMILIVLLSLFPFYWMLRTALSSNNALYAGSDSLLPVLEQLGRVRAQELVL